MKKTLFLFLVLVILTAVAVHQVYNAGGPKAEESNKPEIKEYWLLLNRKSELEYLYFGEAGNKDKSEIVREFKVNTGVEGEKPTPLPSLLGREFWVIIGKFETPDNPETAPYFLTLDVPVSDEEPYGPVPYLECNGQCNWQLPGAFGLHGINGNLEKLTDLGSSGCVRHSDEDITYLYNLLDLSNGGVRYYVEDV